jgi:hypothetical protein
LTTKEEVDAGKQAIERQLAAYTELVKAGARDETDKTGDLSGRYYYGS